MRISQRLVGQRIVCDEHGIKGTVLKAKYCRGHRRCIKSHLCIGYALNILVTAAITPERLFEISEGFCGWRSRLPDWKNNETKKRNES